MGIPKIHRTLCECSHLKAQRIDTNQIARMLVMNAGPLGY